MAVIDNGNKEKKMSTTVIEKGAINTQLVQGLASDLDFHHLQKSPHMVTAAPISSGRSIFVQNIALLARAKGSRVVILSPEPYEPVFRKIASTSIEGVRNCVLELITLARGLSRDDPTLAPGMPTLVLVDDSRFLSDKDNPELTKAARKVMEILLERGAEKGIYIHVIHYSGAIDEELFGPAVTKNLLTQRMCGPRRRVPCPKTWDAEEYTRLLDGASKNIRGHGVTDLTGRLQSFTFPYVDVGGPSAPRVMSTLAR